MEIAADDLHFRGGVEALARGDESEARKQFLGVNGNGTDDSFCLTLRTAISDNGVTGEAFAKTYDLIVGQIKKENRDVFYSAPEFRSEPAWLPRAKFLYPGWKADQTRWKYSAATLVTVEAEKQGAILGKRSWKGENDPSSQLAFFVGGDKVEPGEYTFSIKASIGGHRYIADESEHASVMIYDWERNPVSAGVFKDTHATVKNNEFTIKRTIDSHNKWLRLLTIVPTVWTSKEKGGGIVRGYVRVVSYIGPNGKETILPTTDEK
jgi:hypothetical protein